MLFAFYNLIDNTSCGIQLGLGVFNSKATLGAVSNGGGIFYYN